MGGHKTSVYLPDDLWRAWQESGYGLGELVRAGLEAKGAGAPPLRPVSRDRLVAAVEELIRVLRSGEGQYKLVRA